MLKIKDMDIFKNQSETVDMYTHPTMTEYYTHLTPFITCSMFIGLLVLVLNISIFHTTVTQMGTRISKPVRQLSIFMVSLYPVISLAALITILAPKSWLVCHTIMHISFTFGAVVFRRLCFLYVAPEINFIRETDSVAVSISTPPCCCCCKFLPIIRASRSKLRILRYLIWQMPLVQGSIMLILNTVYYRQPVLYNDVLMYFIPFIVTSITLGVWGLNITVRMINSVHSELGLMKKMLSLQLILLLCKLQYLVLDSQLNAVRLGGEYPINHIIIKQAFINILILFEMVLVSILANSAYRLPIKVTVET